MVNFPMDYSQQRQRCLRLLRAVRLELSVPCDEPEAQPLKRALVREARELQKMLAEVNDEKS